MAAHTATMATQRVALAGTPVAVSRRHYIACPAPVRQPIRRPMVVRAMAVTPKNRSLIDAAERCVERAEANPLEGVPFGYKDFDTLLGKYDFKFNVGDKVTGTIFKVDSKGAYVDIGAKAAAFAPVQELSILQIDSAEDIVAVGQKRQFVIVRDDDSDGTLLVSLKKLEYELAWKRVKQLNEEDVMVRGEVVSVNRGGVLVLVEGLRGFVPTSHLNIGKDDPLGKMLQLKFLEVDEERTRLVLSNRRAANQRQNRDLNIGDVVIGTVQSVKPYGAFIEIGGGVNGLLHISQISHDRIANVENVLNEGDKLKVMVLSCDKERGRISLSTKKLEPTPGDMLRDPALVYAMADEMAKNFRAKVEAAAAAAGEAVAASDSLADLEVAPANSE